VQKYLATLEVILAYVKTIDISRLGFGVVV